MFASNVHDHDQVVVGLGIEPLPLHRKPISHYTRKREHSTFIFYWCIFRDLLDSDTEGDIGEDADPDVKISEPKIAPMYVFWWYLVL